MQITEYVFISYSRRDRAFVDRLVENLGQAGIRVWQDVDEIYAGSDWQAEISKALVGASALLFVASQNSVDSAWMTHELQFFIQRKSSKIIPIILDDVGEKALPVFLAQFQWVDFRADYTHALNFLLASLAPYVDQGPSIKPKSRKSKGYVFLSYAEEDADFVEKLKVFLRKRGYAYWDWNESDRDYHTSLVLELEGIITEAAATLSILSPAWKKSKWTIKEYFFSDEAGIQVFLLKAKEVGPSLAVAGEHFIDFVKDPEIGFERLNHELSRKGL
jgi:hypothetical protein